MNKTILGLAFAMLCTTVTAADDAPAKKKKGNRGRNAPAAQLLKQLKDVELTDEQKTQIQALAKKSMGDLQAARKEAGITPEVMKKRAEAMKELRASDKKPADVVKAANEAAGLTESQVAFFKKQTEQRAALLKGAVALLTEEQKAKLPKRMTQARGKQGAGKGTGKRKKNADQ